MSSYDSRLRVSGGTPSWQRVWGINASSEFPYLAETATDVMNSGFDFAKEFEFGLDLPLEALESWRGREGSLRSCTSPLKAPLIFKQ